MENENEQNREMDKHRRGGGSPGRKSLDDTQVDQERYGRPRPQGREALEVQVFRTGQLGKERQERPLTRRGEEEAYKCDIQYTDSGPA